MYYGGCKSVGGGFAGSVVFWEGKSSSGVLTPVLKHHDVREETAGAMERLHGHPDMSAARSGMKDTGLCL